MSDAGGRLRHKKRLRSQHYRAARHAQPQSSVSGSNAGGCAMLFNLAGAATGAAAGYAQGGVGMAVAGGFIGLFGAGALTSSM